MVPTVTYVGVEGAEGGGTIFTDRKFWLAQRIPMRQTWVDLIKQNGGKVVPLEKQADMLIADHLRKDAPPGSYKWKLIEDSVKNGCMQIEDRYLIGRHPDEPRLVGSHQPSKSTRTKFTPEDDAKLARWALKHPTEQRGNKIWYDYERINPRHTAQSWRDRYIKKLQPLGRTKLETMAASAPEETTPDENNLRETAKEHITVGRAPQGATAPKVPERRSNNPRDPAPTRTASRPRPATMSLQSAREDAPPQPSIEDGQENQGEEQGEDDDAALALHRHNWYQDLDEYIKATERDIKRILNVNGKKIELFDLMLATRDAPATQDSQTTDWYRAAEILGFGEPDQHTVNELQLCYEDNLMDFLESMESFEVDEEEADIESQGAVPDMDHSQNTDFEDAQDSGLLQGYERSSPPVPASSLKRTAGQPFASSERFKKRRYDKDMEIPSTPDASKLPRARETFPSAHRIPEWQDYIGESEASQHLPPLPPLQEESQDLGTRPAPSQDTRHQSVDEPLPDHQTFDSTPIPLRLDKYRQRRNSHERQRELHAEPIRRRHESSFTEKSAPRRAVSSANPNPKPSAQTAVRRSLPASFNPSRNHTSQTNQPRSSENSNSREIQKWISHYISMGYPRQFVVEALKRTTLTPGNMALLVMKHLSEGREVPSHHEGIWTDRDDADLDFVSSVDFQHPPANDSEDRQQERAQKAHNRLVNKHGFERFKLRKAFLEAQSAEGGSYLEG
ncbi:hypothetical protein FBEOM_8315 [Fusarium beomiforme]|uniref:DNA-binding protein RAP1 n=1 Tax=Fusarium beomiforme TaxID=44412 RepID=A0A9P5DUM0_9HYPO|nr:hypothetical protein FBEOM_8315 [Fusarium beomiforme]